MMCFVCHTQEELGTPALAYTKAVQEVLSLDATVGDEVGVLRRNLLRLTQTREFAQEASFKVNLPPENESGIAFGDGMNFLTGEICLAASESQKMG